MTLENKMMRTRGEGLSAIVLSTLGAVCVCLLLISRADQDPKPFVMMDWGKMQAAQMMASYKSAVTAGDAQMLAMESKSPSGVNQPVAPGYKNHRAAHSESAAQELAHLKKLSDEVIPSEKKATAQKREWSQTSAQLLAHYNRLASDSMPADTPTHTFRAAKRTSASASTRFGHRLATAVQKTLVHHHTKTASKAHPSSSKTHSLAAPAHRQLLLDDGALQITDVTVGQGAQPAVGDTVTVSTCLEQCCA